MIATKGYAVHSKTDKLAPWNFERREVGPHDVLIEILFSGICHVRVMKSDVKYRFVIDMATLN